MDFFLKKLIGGWLMPLPLSLTLLALGLLLWRRRTGQLFAGAALLLLFACSWAPVSRWLIEPLESRYPTWQAAAALPVQFVVVMGGSHVDSLDLPITNRLNGASTSRLLEGIAIHRLSPGSRLLLSGGGYDGGRSNAELMAESAEALGVRREDMVLQVTSRDTEQEAELVAEIVGDAPFVVVTSATHMPRTLVAFERVGLAPVPAPTYFLDRRGERSWRVGLDHLAASSAALHEYLGLAWEWLRRVSA